MNKRKSVLFGCSTLLFAVGISLASVILPITPASAAKVTATCANTTTDAAAINATIASSAPGDEVVISGPCLINETIVLQGGRAYRGDSGGTKLTQADGANLTALVASDSYVSNSPTTGDPVSIHDLSLDGNKANNTAPTTGFMIRSWQTTIENVTAANFHGNGIRITNLSANGTALTNSEVNGRIANVFVTDSDDNGIYIEDTGNSITDWNLLDNWVANSGKDGIHLDNAAGWTIERNHVYGVNDTAIYANRLFSTSVSDNYVEDFGQDTVRGTYYGIGVTVQGDAASTIASNRVFNYQTERSGSTYRYLGVQQVNYATGNLSVTGNVIRGKGTTGTGLYYSKGSGTALTIVSTGNSVTNVATQRSVGTGVTLTAGL